MAIISYNDGGLYFVVFHKATASLEADEHSNAIFANITWNALGFASRGRYIHTWSGSFSNILLKILLINTR